VHTPMCSSGRGAKIDHEEFLPSLRSTIGATSAYASIRLCETNVFVML